MKTLNSDKFASKYILPNSALSQAPADDTKRRDKMVATPGHPLVGWNKRSFMFGRHELSFEDENLCSSLV